MANTSAEATAASGTVLPGGGIESQPSLPIPKSHHLKMIGAASLAVLILVAVVIFLMRAQPNSLATTSTVPATTISPLLLLNRSNALYGVPNSSAFMANGTPTMHNNVTGASSYMFLTYYSSMVAPLYTMKPAPPQTYNLTVPAAYSGVAYPFSVTVAIYVYSNASLATQWFNTHFYNPKIGGSAAAGTSFTSNHTTIGGVPAVLESYRPIFTHLGYYEVTFGYGKYIVSISALGPNNTFNSTYLINIAGHMQQIMSSQ